MAKDGRHKDVPVILHSLNEPGRFQMESILKSAGFTKVAQLPHAWIMIEKDENGGVRFDPNKPKSVADWS
jgi:hypothetical protein